LGLPLPPSEFLLDKSITTGGGGQLPLHFLFAKLFFSN
jgi:hypothetical protein